MRHPFDAPRRQGRWPLAQGLAVALLLTTPPSRAADDVPAMMPMRTNVVLNIKYKLTFNIFLHLIYSCCHLDVMAGRHATPLEIAGFAQSCGAD